MAVTGSSWVVTALEMGISGRAVAVGRERRKHPRFVVGGTKGRVPGVGEVSLMNISLGGVMVEHADMLRPGSTSQLVLPLLWRIMRVQCRVVRSELTRHDYGPDGEEVTIYHSGLEFLDPSEETRQVVSQYIETMIEEGQARPSGDGQIRRSYSCDQCGQSFELTDSDVRPVFMDPRKRPVQAGDQFHHKHGTCEGPLTCTFAGPKVPWTFEQDESQNSQHSSQ
ncbi:MAG: PilZ domain-containing protein [Candidatus Methylomirabilales bacterium]